MDNKYNPSPPREAPQAVLTIALVNGVPQVNYQGPPSGLLVSGMCEEAKRILHKKMEEAEKGPQVVAARGVLIQ